MLHPTAAAVVEAAARLGLHIDPREYPDGTRTAADAARAIGCEVGQIVKSLVFTVDGHPVLALVSGSNQLDEGRLAALAGTGAGGAVQRAGADTVRAATGFAIGGVPPFGHSGPLPTFIDEDLLGYDVVYAAAGTPRHTFAVDPTDLVGVTSGTVAALRR
jgi:prolyl-tRNA editing enzyme YbaK/EbsC (Cys-tRNA(Pro) deacylase)